MSKAPSILFVSGAPRSGTTTLLDFLTVTRPCGWVSEALARKPERLRLASRVRRQHWPLLGDFWLERRYAWKRVTSPAEDAAFWEHYLPGFTPDPANPLDPDLLEIDEAKVEALRRAVLEVCRRQGARVFVGHYTGFPRVRLMRRVFPEARFIQMLRDPRSVAYHLVRRVEGGQHDLWDHREAWKARMPEGLRARLESLEDTPLNFSGAMVRWYHQLYKERFAELPESDWREVAYADLVAFPEKTLRRVFGFADLKMNSRFKYYLKYHAIHRSNHRTKRNISEEEGEELDAAVAPLD